MSRYVSLLILSVFVLPSVFFKKTVSEEPRPFVQLLSAFEELTPEARASEESKNAFCSADDYLQAEIAEHEKFFSTGRVELRQIKGLRLADKTDKLDILELVLDDVEPDFIKRYAGHCQNALCVAFELTKSQEAALRIFNMKKRTSYTVNFAQSSFLGAFPEASLWTAKEIRDIETGIQLLPKQFQNLSTLSYFRRDPIGEGFAAAYSIQPNTHTNKHGYILMRRGGLNNINTINTVVHEVAHHYDFTHNEISRQFTQIESAKTSQYAKQDHYEDFAESIADYVIRYYHAQERISLKYNFLKKNIFQGFEYHDLSLEKMSVIDLSAVSDWIVKCSPRISHLDIQKDKLTVSTQQMSLRNKISDTVEHSFTVSSPERDCLLNGSLPVSPTLKKNQICSSVGRHYQIRAALFDWLRKVLVEMNSIFRSTIVTSQDQNLSKKEMLKKLETQLQSMQSIQILSADAKRGLVQDVLRAAQVGSTLIMDYKVKTKK